MDIAAKKEKIFFLLIITLAFLIGYNAIYKQKLSRIEAIKSQMEEEKKKNDILGIIGILDKKLQAYQESSFTTPELTLLLDRISELAREADIQIETFNPLPAVSRDYFVELPVKVPLRCQYHDLGQLFSLIESNPEFIWIKELNMQKPTVTDSREKTAPKIDLMLSGIYIQK